MGWYDNAEEILPNKTLESWKSNFEDTITLYFSDGSRGCFYHFQDCCESVYIESLAEVVKELDKFVGKKITSYNETYARGEKGWNTYTKTTQIFNFEGEELKIEWLGESNGYYSESVNFDYSENV